MPLFDEEGERIRGKENKEAAELALAREKLTWEDGDGKTPVSDGPWLVVRVCSEYIQYCERGAANGTISESHRYNTAQWLNDLCSFCGKRPVAKLKKGHIQQWIDGHETWRSPATRRGVISVVQAAFNRAARFGAGWYGFNTDPAATADALALLDQSLDAAGRKRGDDFEIVITPPYKVDADMIKAYADIGVDRVVVQLGGQRPDQIAKRFDLLGDLVNLDA